MLLQAVNGHISRGGEFEKRAAFVKIYQLPVGTVGLGFLPNGLIVWGNTAKPAGLPAGVQYQQLIHPFAATTKLSVINSFSLFQGKLYVSATFSDGDTYHYYNGVNVADWDYGCAKVTFKVTGGVGGVGKKATGKFKITAGTNAVSNKITGVFVGGVRIAEKSIQHTGNNTTTATAVAKEINRFVSNPNYVAVSKDNEITLTASVIGTAANGKNISVTKTGNVVATSGSMSAGVNSPASTIDLAVGSTDLMARTEWRTSNAVTAQAVVAAINGFTAVRDYHAVWDGADGISIMPNLPGVWANNTVLVQSLTNGFTTNLTAANNKFLGGKDPPADTTAPVNLPYLPGDFVLTHEEKMYALSGPTMYFSKIKDPTKWRNPTTNTGSGFVDMSAQLSGAEELMAIAKYQGYLAVFAYDNILIRYVDADPKLNKPSQALRNTGTRSPHSVCQFGDNDIYYLDESGVRSLRARDSSNSAATTDVGVLVDPLVLTKLRSMTYGQRLKIFGLIEPSDGRFWLIMGNQIFVFSYFSGAKVSAWSTYLPSVPGTNAAGGPEDKVFNVDEAIVFRRRVYIRSGDIIYAYGGEASTLAYDTTQAIMQTPFLDASAPAKEKSFQGWDAAVRGVWEVSASLDPTNQGVAELLGVIDESTTPHNRMTFNAQSTHVSLTFKSRSAEMAKIGSGLVHYASDSGVDDGTR